MNLLFLSLINIDTIEDKGIYTDLLRQFRNDGHNVYIVSPREKRLNLPTEYVIKEGVNYLRVEIGNITKTNSIEKGISTLFIESLFLKEIKKHFNDVKFDLVLNSTPPVTFEKVISFIKKRDSAKSYLLLKDIFPQNAVDLGLFSKRNPVYWYFRNKEIKLYRDSDYIGCMSQANVNYILKHNQPITGQIIEVCPNSMEPACYGLDQKRVKEVRGKYGIPPDKTIFIYGGNLGKPQGIDFVIDCLRANESNTQAYFLIVGTGTERKRLEKYFESEQPQNSLLFNQLSKDEYELLASACDVGLIFLDKRFTVPNFPSRLLSYMQSSIPVLAATDVNSDVGKIIEEGRFGYWCESGDISKFNEKVQRLCDPELRKQMGANARQYLENNYTARHSYEIIMKHFK